jgi:ParB family chromosome partitioning protein
MTKWRVHPEEEPTRAAQALADQVERDGGTVLTLYREPVGDHWQIFALLPMDKVEPTPYQRDLSPTHAKKLRPGVYWTPNGNHRRVVLGKLKAKVVPAILIPEAEVAFQILALNTEKAHNLKEKSLEVIRMYRGLVDEEASSGEEDYSFQFESAHFITLGLLYEQNKRFAGGAFAPILRRVDKFLKGHFPKTLKEREERAALVREADEALGGAVARIKKRGINHPYVKNYVLARTTPLTRQRKTLPGFEQTFRKLVDNIEAFDISKVRYEDIQRSAIMAVPAG